MISELQKMFGKHQNFKKESCECEGILMGNRRKQNMIKKKYQVRLDLLFSLLLNVLFCMESVRRIPETKLCSYFGMKVFLNRFMISCHKVRGLSLTNYVGLEDGWHDKSGNRFWKKNLETGWKTETPNWIIIMAPKIFKTLLHNHIE